MRIVVIGGSDQGRQTIDVLTEAAAHTVVGVIDPAREAGTSVSGLPVLDADALDHGEVEGFVVAVGDNAVRAALVARTRADHARLVLVSAIHPAAVVARDAVVGPGAIVMAGAVVSNGCVLGEGVLMGTKATIDHDNTIDDFASLAPGATTGGNVIVGTCSAIGLGASVIHGVTIGAHSVVGAGAVVVDDVPDHVVAFGVPARPVRPRSEGEPYLRRRRTAT